MKQTLEYKFTKGQIFESPEELGPVKYFLESKWWNYNDLSNDDSYDITVNTNIQFKIEIEIDIEECDGEELRNKFLVG